MIKRASIALSFGLAAACASGRPQLTPSPRATASAAAPGAVRSEDGGVELIAQVDAWPGDPRLARDVIPMRVVIRNGSPEQLRLRYDDIMLVAADGSHYAALPPIGPDHLTREQNARRTVPDPTFEHTGFLVAPYLAYAYPTLPAYSEAYDYEQGYFRRYEERAEAVLRDDPQALSLGIPEGVLQSGGAISGFLYFEPVDSSDADKGLVRLHADLEAADASELATLSIPFAVED
jgi:hypothetical protein